MKGTSVRCFNSLAKKIHPPLPRSSRESQQLLNLLTSSFRRHLDNQHPSVQPTEPPSTTSNGSVNSASSPTATERHLSSILQHPLFNTVPSKLSSSSQIKHPDHHITGVHGLRDHDPLDILDDAMASGRASSQTLHDCLKAHRSSMKTLSNLDLRQSMVKAKVGRKIVSWFLGANPEARDQIFANRHTMALVMPYLASEGLQSTVTTWLELLRDQRASHAAKHSDDNSFSEFNILYEYVAAEIKFGQGINNALQFFLLSCSNSSGSEISKFPPPVPSYPFRPTACYLAQWISSPDHQSDVRNIPAELFNKFCAVCTVLPNKFWGASLPLYHPTEPAVEPALKYIRNCRKYDKNQRAKSDRPDRPDRSDRLLQITLEAASFCLQRERYTDASWLIACAKELLPTNMTTSNVLQKQQGEEYISADELSSRLSPTLG